MYLGWYALFLSTFKTLNGKHPYVTKEETEHQREKHVSRAIQLISIGANICSLNSLIPKFANFQVDFTVIVATNLNHILP